MKTALFVHDHCFLIDSSGNIYSEGKITDQVFDRYHIACEKVNVLSRLKETKDPSELVQIRKKNVFFFPVKGNGFSRIFSIFLLKNLKNIFSLVKDADFLILRLPSFLGISAFIFAIFMGKKYVVEMVGHPKKSIVASGKIKFFGKIFANIFSFLNYLAIDRALAVIYVTQKALQKDYPTRGLQYSISDINLSVRDNFFDKIGYEFKKNIPVVGMIGSYNNSYKGVDIAIKAIACLKEENIVCQLKILGSGKSDSYLELARSLGVVDYVFFDGVKKGETGVYEWLDGLDIYIQPSRTEGLPRSLLEAMSRGLPCIASNIGGMPELVDEEFLFESEDFYALSNRISTLYSSALLREKIGLKNYQVALGYDKKIILGKQYNAWEKIASLTMK